MFVIVKKNCIHESGAESASSKTYTDYNIALRDFYSHLSANVADQSVERFDITILNDTLIPCKTEHYERNYAATEE
ncbi:MAG: hypothetical protein MJZ85_10430 [Bacteroidales bacterium]|nr:hypothetical protein [Bacteroidales bacterium]